MKNGKILSLTVLLLVAAFLCAACGPPLREAGRFSDDVMDAEYIFYYMKKDIPEAELKEMLKPLAREAAKSNSFVIQVAVYDKDFAARLASPESAQKFKNNELFVGNELVNDPSAAVKGGMVYTYYKDGDYDEWFYTPKH